VHSAGIIHLDLKPKNLFVSLSFELRIGDFGVSRNSCHEALNLNRLTDYVCTRWYRPPELLCGSKAYSDKVDIWACGCILVEMFTRVAMFPGLTTFDQLAKIMKYVGTPTIASITKVCKKRKIHAFLSQQPQVESSPLKDLFTEINFTAEVEDLVRKMVAWDPDARPDCSSILAHVYLVELHDEGDEPTRDAVHELFEHERRKVDMDYLEKELFDELLEHYPHLAAQLKPTKNDITSYDLLPQRNIDDDEEASNSEDDGGADSSARDLAQKFMT
jgi:serine/threonine protein kinase